MPTDFSKNAWHAINYALELYKDDPCDFYVLNAFMATGYLTDSLLVPEPGEDYYESAKLESENGLAKVLDMISFKDNKNTKHKFHPLTTFNNPLEAIINTVEDKDIELVVMGTKGQTGSRKVIYGSNAILVMEKVRNCPVIVVPKDAKHNLPKEIVFPTNYKSPFKRRELNYLIEIAKKCNAAIRVIHVLEEKKLNKNQMDYKAMLNTYFEGLDYSFHQLRHMDIAAAINCFIESRDSDMVAFINKKHMFFGSILSQPLVKNIGYHSSVPMLVMHDLRN